MPGTTPGKAGKTYLGVTMLQKCRSLRKLLFLRLTIPHSNQSPSTSPAKLCLAADSQSHIKALVFSFFKEIQLFNMFLQKTRRVLKQDVNLKCLKQIRHLKKSQREPPSLHQHWCMFIHIQLRRQKLSTVSSPKQLSRGSCLIHDILFLLLSLFQC